MPIKRPQTKRMLVRTRKIIRTLGSDDINLRTGNPYADMVIDRMQDTSERILKKTHDLLFRQKGRRI